jgi:hypothetical protein
MLFVYIFPLLFLIINKREQLNTRNNNVEIPTNYQKESQILQGRDENRENISILSGSDIGTKPIRSRLLQEIPRRVLGGVAVTTFLGSPRVKQTTR